MKIIPNENIIYLDNEDEIIIKKENKKATLIKCLHGSFTIDDISLEKAPKINIKPEQVKILKTLISKKNSIQIRTLFHNPRKIILNENESIFIRE